ncbi:uncharacterized protein SPSK_05339 [Sporothrix schenckii 1099-18]|uniref:Uncharacterized protein n=1 Tax=Sporothrix schenckii 1099-18 TaxID=1397361 RepID=A0A0F2LS77_SPOSC|nr:uncharacterized protein SPSK_05339 [Sporothrix schenckii 1099-18]KJR80347.1 hypothetical protein SPSK_05339 [Sporothrix schenckii 1099-18]
MGLADGVDALLEAYAKCLSLLRIFSSSGDGYSSYSDGQFASPSSSERDRQSELGRSLQADRAKIQRAYSKRLSETGSRLQKGDGQSRSALRRIVRRLTDALASILGFGSSHRDSATPDGRPLLNYDALRALSNASRIDAIHAIDEASVRMSGHRHRGSRSSVSVRSRGSRASSGVSPPMPHPSALPTGSGPLPDGEQRQQKNKGNKKHRRAGSSSGSSHSSQGSRSSARDGNVTKSRSRRPGEPQIKPKKKATPSARESTAQAQQRGPHRHHGSSHSTSSGSSRSGRRRDSGSTIVRSPSAHQNDSGHRVGRRVSMLSRSSASTKLGEIPEHKLRRRPKPADSSDNIWQREAPEYDIRPAYPMRPLWVPDVPEPQQEKAQKQKRFWGMFRRS